jgi:hypothetical protein
VIKVPGEIVAAGVPFDQQRGHAFGVAPSSIIERRTVGPSSSRSSASRGELRLLLLRRAREARGIERSRVEGDVVHAVSTINGTSGTSRPAGALVGRPVDRSCFVSRVRRRQPGRHRA